MKAYEVPEIEVIDVSSDIITTSPSCRYQSEDIPFPGT
jgi:predicted metal-binding protein